MGKRDEARAENTEKILAAARAEIALVGGVGLSMRSVARDVGMVSSAIYRYFATREDLLTALILESYEALAQELRAAQSVSLQVSQESSRDSAGSEASQWRGLAAALRSWALDRTHEFQLIYGTPIPGYVAPPATVPAAAGVALPFLQCLGTAPVTGYECFEAAGENNAGDGLRVLAAEVGISSSAAAGGVAALSELIGFVGHEIAGHFVGMADPADDFFAAVVGRQVRDLCLS